MTHEKQGRVAGERRVYLEYLDGVRGMAAIFVVAHHLWRSYTTVAVTGVAGVATNWLLYGHLAVDVFIVLSGFCLMLPVARSRGLRGGWRRFYKGRARRILPPLYAAIGIAVFEFVIHHYPPTKWVVLANVLLVQDVWQSKNSLDPPLWSVAVECKIYLLFPALVWLWLRLGARGVVVASAAIAALFYWVVTKIPLVTDQGLICPWYLFLFALGMVAADFAVRRDGAFMKKLPWLLIAALVGLAATLAAWPVTGGGESVLFVPHLPIIDRACGLATGLLLTMLAGKAIRRERSWLIGVFTWKPWVFLGTIAYSLYLVHVFVIYEFKNMLVAWLPVHPAWAVMPLDLTVTVGLAWLFHLVIERPFMSKRAPRNEREAELAAAFNPAP